MDINVIYSIKLAMEGKSEMSGIIKAHSHC